MSKLNWMSTQQMSSRPNDANAQQMSTQLFKHSVIKLINIKWFLELACFCQKLTKLLSEGKNAINMTIYILFCISITHIRAELCLLNHLELINKFKKNMVSTLQPFVVKNQILLIKVVALSLRRVRYCQKGIKTINSHNIHVFFFVSMEVHWKYIFIETISAYYLSRTISFRTPTIFLK